MLLLSVVTFCALRPCGPIVHALSALNANRLVLHIRYLWVPLAIGAPVLLALLSAAGYHYSAMQLQTRLQATGWLIVFLVIGGETLMRWLYIARRRMLFQQAVEERLAERRARHAAALRAGSR